MIQSFMRAMEAVFGRDRVQSVKTRMRLPRGAFVCPRMKCRTKIAEGKHPLRRVKGVQVRCGCCGLYLGRTDEFAKIQGKG